MLRQVVYLLQLPAGSCRPRELPLYLIREEKALIPMLTSAGDACGSPPRLSLLFPVFGVARELLQQDLLIFSVSLRSICRLSHTASSYVRHHSNVRQIAFKLAMTPLAPKASKAPLV